MHLGDDQIPEIHGLGAILLGEEHITHSGRQHLTEQIVIGQVHAQFFPHFDVIRHEQFSLFL